MNSIRRIRISEERETDTQGCEAFYRAKIAIFAVITTLTFLIPDLNSQACRDLTDGFRNSTGESDR